jgi:hypothetical protein
MSPIRSGAAVSSSAFNASRSVSAARTVSSRVTGVAGWQADLTPVGGEFLQNQLEQGGFADAIAPDQPDLGAHRQRDSRGIEEATAPAVEHEIVDLKHVEQHQRMGQWV